MAFTQNACAAKIGAITNQCFTCSEVLDNSQPKLNSIQFFPRGKSNITLFLEILQNEAEELKTRELANATTSAVQQALPRSVCRNRYSINIPQGIRLMAKTL